MRPSDFEGSNAVYRAPAGISKEDCGDLPILRNGPLMTSCWIPDDHERAQIAAGGPIFLTVFGSGHPMVSLGTDVPSTSDAPKVQSDAG